MSLSTDTGRHNLTFNDKLIATIGLKLSRDCRSDSRLEKSKQTRMSGSGAHLNGELVRRGGLKVGCTAPSIPRGVVGKGNRLESFISLTVMLITPV